MTISCVKFTQIIVTVTEKLCDLSSLYDSLTVTLHTLTMTLRIHLCPLRVTLVYIRSETLSLVCMLSQWLGISSHWVYVPLILTYVSLQWLCMPSQWFFWDPHCDILWSHKKFSCTHNLLCALKMILCTYTYTIILWPSQRLCYFHSDFYTVTMTSLPS